MDYNALNKSTYNKIAADWQQESSKRTWWLEYANQLAGLLRPGGKVLDIGCGDGARALHLSNQGFQVLGIDFSEELIKIAKTVAPRAQFRVLDLYQAETILEKFDGIFMQAVLLHIPRARAPGVIQLYADKLIPGGYFYIGTKEKKSDLPEEEIKTEDDYGYEYQRFFSYYSSEEIKEYLQKAGLNIIHKEVLPAGRTRWIQVIAKKT